MRSILVKRIAKGFMEHNNMSIPKKMECPCILKHKMPHGFLCFVTHSLKTILEKSEEVFMLRVRILDKGVRIVSSLYLTNIGTL